MANYCQFDMKIVGSKKCIKEFLGVMRCDEYVKKDSRFICGIYDAMVTYFEEKDGIKKWEAGISGGCKWSILSSMTESGYFEHMHDNSRVTTLKRESEKLHLKIETFSEECGMEFQEHYLYDNGNLIIDDCVNYSCFYVIDYETKKEAEEKLGVEFTDEEWIASENNDGYIERGGMSWDFLI